MNRILNNLERLPLSENTIRNYKSQFKSIHRDLSVNDSLVYLNDSDKLLSYIASFDSEPSMRMKTNVLINVLRGLKKPEIIEDLREFLLQLKEIRIEKEFKPEISLKDIKQLVNNIENSRDRLTLRLVTHYPPLRGDYNSIKLKNFNKKNDNYFDGENLIFNNLLKVDNKIKIKLKQTDINLIKEIEGDKLYDFQLVETFNKYLRSISENYLGQSYGIQHYRKLYTSTILNGKLAMDAKANELAKSMNHTLGTQSEYYLKEI